jgi:S1-C subfamily serine protease
VKNRLAVVALALLLARSDAIGQNLAIPLVAPPAPVQTAGAPIKETPIAGTLLPSMSEIDSDIPTSQLSELARYPAHDVGSSTRSAKDAAVYRAVSPAVVVVLTKTGLGSGSLVSTSGEVLTSWHVVQGFSSVAVVFKPAIEGAEPGRDDMKVGHVVKYDEVADLALIKVDDVPPRRTPIRLGDAGEISVGADVHAIGHPDAEAWSYTKGVISQYRREFSWSSEDDRVKHKADIIQTQTPINPGNSGGPLISDAGTLLGVNAFKSEGEGLNFAVSVDDAKRFLSRPGNVVAFKQQERPPTARCEVKETARFRSTDNKASVTAYDYNCSGKSNAEYIVPDKASEPIVLTMDRNGDGMTDVIFYDLQHRGKWDLSYWDEKYSGRWTLVGFHGDGSLKPTSFESYDMFQKRLADKR